MPASKKKANIPTGTRELTNENQQQRFLEEYAKNANVSLSAHNAKVDRNRHYDWLRDDPSYRKRFEEAHRKACDVIDAEIHRRGVKGWNEPVWYQGVKCGAIRKYDSTLLIFFAKGLMPAKYRENVKAEIEHTGGVGIQATASIDLSCLTDEQYELLKSVIRAGILAAGQPQLEPGPGTGRPEESPQQD